MLSRNFSKAFLVQPQGAPCASPVIASHLFSYSGARGFSVHQTDWYNEPEEKQRPLHAAADSFFQSFNNTAIEQEAYKFCF
jgi:hypothetical protein